MSGITSVDSTVADHRYQGAAGEEDSTVRKDRQRAALASAAHGCFSVLRAAPQRHNDAHTPYARMQILGQIRVVVKERESGLRFGNDAGPRRRKNENSE